MAIQTPVVAVGNAYADASMYPAGTDNRRALERVMVEPVGVHVLASSKHEAVKHP